MIIMEPETANITRQKGQTKLSKLQRLILVDILERYHEVQKHYEKYGAENVEWVISIFAINSKDLSWRIAQKYDGKTHLTRDEAKADFEVKRAKALASMTGDSLPFMGFVTRVWNERWRRGFRKQLLPAFRASMSKSLKRLERRGLITRERWDKYEGRYKWSKPKTTGIYLTPEGLEIARLLSPPGMLAVSAKEEEAEN